MTPIEFVLWLNGAVGLLDGQPPTPEQWAVINDKLGEAVGHITTTRLLEHANEALHRQRELEEKQYHAKQAMAAQLASMKNHTIAKNLAGPSTLSSGAFPIGAMPGSTAK